MLYKTRTFNTPSSSIMKTKANYFGIVYLFCVIAFTIRTNESQWTMVVDEYSMVMCENI